MNGLTDTLFCDVDKWEGNQQNKANMAKVMEKRKQHENQRLNKQQHKHSKSPPVSPKSSNHAVGGGIFPTWGSASPDNWDHFQKQQKHGILPTLTTVATSLYAVTTEQKEQRKHAVGNQKLGGISHRQAVCVEPMHVDADLSIAKALRNNPAPSNDR